MTTTERAPDERGDDGWCEGTGMSYRMMDQLDDLLRGFLPDPFHDERCDCWRCLNNRETTDGVR